MEEFIGAKRVVLKIGTSTLTYESGHLNLRRVQTLCRVLADIQNSGRQVIVVSSGAIAVGVGKLRMGARPQDVQSKQAAAAVGQCELMAIYDRGFAEYGHTVAQLLLTRQDIDSDARRGNVINTLSRLLEMGAIPIINENDTVATEELEFGDNDTLSAIVSVMAGADLLVLMSDIDGLFTADPNKCKDARLIERVGDITPELEALAGDSSTERGTGGMITKLQAAKICRGGGVNMAIINGARPENIYDVLEGRRNGTAFVWGENNA